MKSLLFSLVFVLISMISNSQTVYRASITEFHTWNSSKSEWQLHSKNSDVKIQVCVEDEFLTIFAQTPTMYKVYKNTKENISFSKYSGYRYTAKDLKTDLLVILDIVGNSTDGVALLSVMNKAEGYNLRYFLIID